MRGLGEFVRGVALALYQVFLVAYLLPFFLAGHLAGLAWDAFRSGFVADREADPAPEPAGCSCGPGAGCRRADCSAGRRVAGGNVSG